VILEPSLYSETGIISMQYGGIVIYLDEIDKQKLANPISSGNFIEIIEFLEASKEDLKRKIENADIDYRLDAILKAEDEIKEIENDKEFEVRLTELLDGLKKNKSQIQELLELVRKNQNNFLGTKFVHVGGNHPADIIPINLYSYISKFLEINDSTAYEAKHIAKDFKYEKFIEKTRTATGHELIFITTAERVAPRIWEHIITSYKNRLGRWEHIVIDFNLLTIIWAYYYYLGSTKNSWNKSS
ncbi:MAG: hypothetical protein NTY83_00670, partial [Candidatus Micrarchaeota archaeon]|nr:hypothetical protein [Candidatus Micrarchaeota archaeon]